MIQRQGTRSFVNWAALGAVGLMGTTAYGAGFGVRVQSASSIGTAGASDAGGTQDISAIYFNPAAIGAFKGQKLALGAAYVNLRDQYEKGSRTVPYLGVEGTANGKTHVNNFGKGGFAPALFGVHQVADAVNLGWSLTVPYSTHIDYPSDWVGRYHGIKTSLQVVNFDLGASYEVHPRVSVGAALMVQQSQGEMSAATNLGALGAIKASETAKAALSANAAGDQSKLAALTGLSKTLADVAIAAKQAGKSEAEVTAAFQQAALAATVGADGKTDVVARYEGGDIGYGYSLGVLARPVDQLSLGLAYRSQVKHGTTGDMTFSGDSAEAQSYIAGQQNEKSGHLDVTLPSVISLGAAYKVVSDLTLFANVTQTQWSSIDSLNVKYKNKDGEQTVVAKLDWQDVMAVGLGASYQWDPHVVLRTGLAMDQSPTTDQYRSPRSPDADRKMVALGAGYAGSNWQVDFGWSHFFVDEAKVALKEDDYPEAKGRGNLSGTMKVQADTVMVQYAQKL